MKTPVSLLSLLKNVSPNLFRHKSTLIYYGIKKIGGRRTINCLKTADRKTADRLLTAWLGGLQANMPGEGGLPDLTVGQLLTKFLELRAGMSKSTLDTEQSIAKKFRALFDATGQGINLKANRVRHSHLVLWLNAIVVGDDGKPLRNSSYNRHRLFLMQLFAFAQIEAKIENPFNVAAMPAKGSQRIIRHVPTAEEFTAIIADIRHPQWPNPNLNKRGGQRPLYQPEAADFAEYLGLAGVGQAEAATLEWQDVDWSLGTVRYTRHKTSKPFAHPIYQWLEPVLKRLLGESRTKEGRLFKIKDVRHSLNSAKKRLKMPNFTQRSLRAFLIGRLWKAGVNVKLIAKWQGHSDGGKLIMSTYTEVFGSNDQEYERQELAKVPFDKIVPFAATG